MTGLYAEARVKCKTTPKTIALKLLCVVAIVVAVFVLPMFSTLLVFVSAAIIVGLVYMFPRLNVEYEYVFCDGQFDFDKITGGSKRKTVVKIDFDQIEMIAPMGSHALDSFKNNELKMKNFTSMDRQKKPYVMIGHVGNDLVKILFEPSEKMLDCMRSKAPRKVATC